MLFNSFAFLIFFPVVVALYWVVRRNESLRIALLLIASFIFYATWSPVYALMMMGMTVIDYFVAGRIAATSHQPARRRWLGVSLVSNLGILFGFKYLNFLADNLSALAAALGYSIAIGHHSLELPLGISFFTFEALSYTVDVYRGTIAPARSLPRFALFISFFPRLIAGPIIRAATFLPQIEREPKWDDARAQDGLTLIMTGLFRKICIADVLATTLVDSVFADSAGFGSWTLLLAMYGYAFQIYFDFSGYSNVAIGAAKILGFELPLNFNRPYLATSIRDFWRRWHISLSTWLRDYLYIPLGGGRGSTWKTARNLAIVMLLGGLWHGAAWGFVVWGAAHGLLLGAGRFFHSLTGIDADADDQPVVTRLARIVVTFHLVAGCFVLFRAVDFTMAGVYLTRLATFQPGPDMVSPLAYAVLALAMAIEFLPRHRLAWLSGVLTRVPAPLQGGVIAAALLLFFVLSDTAAPFIYFQF